MDTLTRVVTSLDRILVPTDFSDVSQQALEYAKSIAKRYDSRLFLVHVTEPSNLITPPEAVWIDQQGIQERLEQRLEQAGAGLRSEGYWAEAFSITGAIRKELLTFINENKVDIIVLGTHSKAGFERFLLGSDAETILRKVTCPVVLVGPKVTRTPGQTWNPRNILCATTLDPQSAWIAAYAYQFARLYRADFTLLNIEDPSQPAADWAAFENSFMDSLPGTAFLRRTLRTLVSDCAPGRAIVDVAEERNADLIVMGAHPAPARVTHFAAGTVPQVAAEAICPVMTLHE
ncbi:MAG TPA: universal stress protein [Acidobacteriaceae bacterium]|nr:universal stress protein [Acidobacteriaceae bacterium]